MKSFKHLLAACLILTASPAFAVDQILTLPATQAAAQTQVLRLGPGALGTLTFPDTVTDVTVTRNGLVETRVVGNRVLIAGLTTHGTTPIIITTESGTYTWRIVMSGPQASSIINITVTEPEQAVTAPASAPATPERVTPAALTTITAADTPRVTYTAVRDGNTLVLTYRVQAGAKPVTFDERQLIVTGPSGPVIVKTTVGTLTVQPGATRYGTVTMSAADAGAAPVIQWAYRVGLVTATAQQSIQVP